MISLAAICSIAEQHGLPPPGDMPVPWTGAASHVYPLGDVVIKVPFDRPDTIEAVTTEAAIAPLARDLGVLTPELSAFDDSRGIIPVPYAVFRRVDGAVSLQHLARGPVSVRDAWEAAGRQLARVHGVRHGMELPCELREFRQSPEIDPRPWMEEFRSTGALAQNDANWLHNLLEQLAADALVDVPLVLCHGDVNAANILVNEGKHQFRALIDWAGAGWLDPAWDFAGVSLDAVPILLEGHRSVAPLPLDLTAEARICWCQIQMRLFTARKAAPDATSSDELPMHLDKIKRFVETVGLLR